MTSKPRLMHWLGLFQSMSPSTDLLIWNSRSFLILIIQNPMEVFLSVITITAPFNFQVKSPGHVSYTAEFRTQWKCFRDRANYWRCQRPKRSSKTSTSWLKSCWSSKSCTTEPGLDRYDRMNWKKYESVLI